MEEFHTDKWKQYQLKKNTEASSTSLIVVRV